jgi:hypothetical protein
MEKNKGIMNDMVTIKKTVIRKPVMVVKEDEHFFIPEQSEPAVTSRSGCLLWCIAGVCSIALIVGIGGLFTHATINVNPKVFTGSLDTTINLSQSHGGDTLFFGTATKNFTNEKVVPAVGQILRRSKGYW